MKVTEQAVRVMAEYLAEAHSGRLWDFYTADTRELLIENCLPTAEVALRSALPHLTDDGAGAPPADIPGIGVPAAAESATTTPAPSSPIREHAIRVLVDLLQEANRHDIAALARQGWPGIPEVPDYDMRVHCGHLVDALVKAGVIGDVS